VVGVEPPPPQADINGKKVSFPADVVLWPDYARILERISKDKRCYALNRRPPPEAFKNGKLIAIVGKQGTRTHKGNHKINFEEYSFKSMLVKYDIIDQLFLIGDVAPPQVPPIDVYHATHYVGATTRTTSAISAATNDRSTLSYVPLLPVTNKTAVTPILPPSPTTNAQATIADTSVPETSLTPRPYLPILSRNVLRALTRDSTNESGDFPESENDSDKDINRGTWEYSDPLVDGMWVSQEGEDTYFPWEANAEAADEE
jgi:hypothetical protein